MTFAEGIKHNAAGLYMSGQFICIGILVSSIRQGWEYAALSTVIPVATLGYLVGKKSKESATASDEGE